VVKVIWHKTTSPPQTDGSIMAHWRHLANMIELVLPTAHPSQQPKREIDWFNPLAQLTADSLYTLQRVPLSLGTSEPKTQAASRSVQPLSHRWPQSVPILYNGTPLPPQKKLPLPMKGSGPHLIHGSLGSPEFSPKWHLNRFSHFCRLTSVTDQLTDHATRLVTIDCIYVCSMDDSI